MDRKLVFNGDFMRADLSLDGGAIALTGGLETAVVISLFTNRRARADDALPDGAANGPDGGDRQGWWADAYNDRPIGSRLWLLSREKQLPAVLARAKDYAEEALAWLVEDRIASRVTVTAEMVRTGVLGLAIDIDRIGPAGNAGNSADGPVSFRFSYAWISHAV